MTFTPLGEAVQAYINMTQCHPSFSTAHDFDLTCNQCLENLEAFIEELSLIRKLRTVPGVTIMEELETAVKHA